MEDAPDPPTQRAAGEVAEHLARKYLGIETLTTQNRDALDFHDLAVRKIKSVLVRAYEAGRASVQLQELR